MNPSVRNGYSFVGTGLVALSMLCGFRAPALQPETLFNFGLGLDTVTGSLVEGPDGNFYGTTARGGPSRSGTVFRVTPAGALTTLVSDQSNPAAGLVVGNDSLLYGMTAAGGAGGFGTVFKLSTSGVLTNFAVFDGLNGRSPLSGLVLAGDGNFYGASQGGGANGFGAVFRVTPGGVVTALVSLNGASLGGFAVAGLTLGPEGNLYGITSAGGSANRGTIFTMTPGGSFTTLHSFNGANGAAPSAELARGADGQLYGTTQQGGSANVGTIFKVTTNGALTTLVSFTSAANGMPQAGLLLASDGNFYGCSAGAVFRMTPEGALTTLASLYPLSGSVPEGGLIFGQDGSIYGTTRLGGSNNAGTIFRLTADGSFTSLFSFDTTNGLAPQAGLLQGRDGSFYGTTSLGGANNSGTVFRFSTNGTIATLASFGGTNGANPQCQLVMDRSGNLYGTAPEGGPNFDGTVFSVTTNGALTILVSFNLANGASPQGDGLAVGNDGNFYGTTADGGSNGFGTVFRMTPGGVLTSLFSFDSANGSAPEGGLVQGQDGCFYGSTSAGGISPGFGTIFKITTNGALTTLFKFHLADGQEPATRLIQANDGALYGTTLFGGPTNGLPASPSEGTVFRISTNGAFTSLLTFQGTNGSGPLASLVMGNDRNLYGTTTHGGPGGGGTIFRVVLTPHLTGVARLTNGNFVLTGTGPSASPFSLWASTDPSTPLSSWTLLTTGVFAADGTFSYTDASEAVPARFYRLSTP